MSRAPVSAGVAAIVAELESAAAARKCHRCGCFSGALEQLRRALPALPAEARERLLPVVQRGSERLLPSAYDCLGCAVCSPANALILAAEAFPGTAIGAEESCPTDIPAVVPGWPPFPGNYRVLDAGGDVALCVLTSEPLIDCLAAERPPRVGIVGSVYTENLGLERIIANVAASPNLATLVLCGADSHQRIGHLPGQSLRSLVANGLDDRGQIIGAQGRRPVLKNIAPDLVAWFRTEVAVVDLIGEEDPGAILGEVHALPPRRRRLAAPGSRRTAIQVAPPDRLVLDPQGFFVLFPDPLRGVVVVEHYENSGRLAHVFEGTCSDHLYPTILAHDLVSRLDHAAYLGQELARAFHALATGEPYVQDRAPEPSRGAGCGCHVPRRRPAEERA